MQRRSSQVPHFNNRVKLERNENQKLMTPLKKEKKKKNINQNKKKSSNIRRDRCNLFTDL